MRIRVHYNLRKHCLSILDKRTRRVIGYTSGIVLRNVRFVASAKGIARIRRLGRKQVVAFVEGDMASLQLPTIRDITTHHRQCYFNPYRWDTFVDIGHKPVTSAAECVLINKSMFAAGLQ
jgi:hypothetical protein